MDCYIIEVELEGVRPAVVVHTVHVLVHSSSMDCEPVVGKSSMAKENERRSP